MKRHLIISALLLMSAAYQASAQGQLNLKVKDYMTVTEFQDAGLSKLTPSELSALDKWFSTVAEKLVDVGKPQTKTEPPKRTNTTLDFATLVGATIIAEDGQFLGKITSNSIDSQSIINDIGRFGSEISSTSIRNTISRYGSTISSLSPFNDIASTPPRIYKNGEFVAYLTTNRIKTPRIDPRALIGWLQSQN
jgi:hypothetical protein